MIIACLQIYRELLSLATFLRVHSNSEEVSYLSLQNTYPNLKTTCHIKLNLFLWTKLSENLLLEKYLIYKGRRLCKEKCCEFPKYFHFLKKSTPQLFHFCQFGKLYCRKTFQNRAVTKGFPEEIFQETVLQNLLF